MHDMTTDLPVSERQIARECAALRTRMAARRVTRAFDEALRPTGLKVTQFSLLVAIRLGAPSSISELADRLALERTTLTRNLQLLEKDGLIALGPEGPRRARSMRLTTKGEEVLAQGAPLWRQAQDTLVRKMGADLWQQTKANLEALSRT